MDRSGRGTEIGPPDLHGGKAMLCPHLPTAERETQRDRKRQRERRVEWAPHFLEMGEGKFAQTRGRPPIIVLDQK